jgi:hypothetical protein
MNSEISTYTISVYELQEIGFDFGLNDYPIWNEAYRPILNKAILDFYMFREIGYINPNVWRQRLRNRMDIIMRNKYNALYTAKAKDFNPLYTMELYEEFSHNIDNTGTNSNNGEVNFNTTSSTNTSNNSTTKETTESESEGLNVTSNFPSEEMTEGDLSENLYVDGATKQKANDSSSDNTTEASTGLTSNTGTDKTINTNTGSNTNKTVESYSKKTYGSASDLSFAHAMVQFKDYCDKYDLDNQVIAELKDLFISVW